MKRLRVLPRTVDAAAPAHGVDRGVGVRGLPAPEQTNRAGISRERKAAWRAAHQAACKHAFDENGGCVKCGLQSIPSADDNPAAGTGTEATA